MSNRPLAIVFDVFGTLANIGDKKAPYRFLLNCDSEQGRALQKNDDQDFASTKSYFEEVSDKLGMCIPTPILIQLDQMLDEEIESIHLYDDTLSTIADLQAAGYKIAICSHLPTPYDQAVHLLLPDVDAYMWSNELNKKQDKETIYQDLIKILDCSVEDILFVGDSPFTTFDHPIDFKVPPRLVQRQQGHTLKHVLDDLL